MKIKRKILMSISMITLLFIGCSNINSNQNIKIESKQNQNELNKDSLENIEHHVPYTNLDTGEIDIKIINERYNNIDKEKLNYDAIDIDSLVENHNNNSDNMSKIYIAEQSNGDTSYKTILEGYSYISEGNTFNFTYSEAIELVKKVLPDDIEEVDYILNKELNTEYKYYKSSKGNFRVNLHYSNDFSDKNIDEIHKDSIISISYSKEFR